MRDGATFGRAPFGTIAWAMLAGGAIIFLGIEIKEWLPIVLGVVFIVFVFAVMWIIENC